MDPTAELAAVVHRLSPPAYERLLLLLHCLLCSTSDSAERPDAESSTALSLSVPSLCAILLSACPGPAPRFLFALAGNDKLIRSPDGGCTWRASFSRSNETTTPAAGPNTSADDVLNEMQSLVTSAAAVEGEGESEAATAAASSALCSAHGYEEVVALCGPPHFLAVSGDRGVTYATTMSCVAPGSGAAAPLQHVRVLDRHRVVVSDGTRVFCVVVAEAGLGKVALGAATVVLTCASQIGLLHTYTTAGGGRALLVGERGVLHLSLDGAASFLEVRHGLGQIRDVDAMDAVRRSEQPPLPDDLAAAALDADDSNVGDNAAKPANAAAAASPFTYLTGYRRSAHSSPTQLTALTHFERFAQHDKKGLFYQLFFVSGCGAEVLPYDYTAVLCICTRRLQDTDGVVVLSCATRVCYVPFSHARLRERLPCLVVRRVGTRGFVASRGSPVGVSTSTDLAQWTTPQGAAPVGLVALSGGDVWSCGRRTILTPVGSATAKPRTVPHVLRIPYLLTAFTM